MNTFLIVGSAATVAADLEAWGDRPANVIAVNKAIRALPERPWAGATLHPEKAESFAREGVPLYSWRAGNGIDRVFPKAEMWNGTSALYAVRIALAAGAERVVLAGCPLDGGAYCDGRTFETKHLNQYRLGWLKAAARKELDRVTSLSGWTRELLGAPDGV